MPDSPSPSNGSKGSVTTFPTYSPTAPDVPVGFESIADSLTGSDRARQSYLLVQEDSPSDRVGR